MDTLATCHHCRPGLAALAAGLVGTEIVHAGVRPFGVHPGNRIVLSVYPLLLARALAERGTTPRFTMLVTINDIEPREYDHFALSPAGEMASAAEVAATTAAVRADLDHLTREFPEVRVNVRLSSSLVDAPAFREVFEMIARPDALGNFLTAEIMTMMQLRGGEFAGLVCTACRHPTRANAGEDCPRCGAALVASSSDVWMYYIPLIAAKLAVLRPEVMLIGGDYLSAQPEIGAFMKHRHPLEAVQSCRAMVSDAPIRVLTGPVLMAADGRKMSKSLGNLADHAFEDIVAVCLASDDSTVSIQTRVEAEGTQLDPVVRSLLSSETAFQNHILNADAETLRAARQPRVNPLALPALPDVARRSIAIGLDPPLNGLYFAPASIRPRAPAVVFFHGGGLVSGSIEDEASLCQHIAAALGAHVFSIDYRLAPEHRYPAAHEDALAGYAAIAGRAEDWDIDPARIAVAGASAGAGLAVAVCIHRRGAGLPPPAAQLLYYPALHPPGMTDSARCFGTGFGHSTALSQWYARQVLGNDDSLHSGLYPLLEEDLSGLPPAVIASAGFDPARDDAARYADRLRDAGTPVEHSCWERLTHGFLGYPRVVPDARAAIDASLVAVARVL